MIDLAIGAGVSVLTFVFAYLGMLGQKLLPESHMTSGARDMIGAVMGLIALLLALVLGTLVGSAYGFFATQRANVETLAARTVLLDLAYKQYGPEAATLRSSLDAAMTQAYQSIWVESIDPRKLKMGDLVRAFEHLNNDTADLKPQTPRQLAAMPTINASIGIIEQTRFLMAMQNFSSISWPLIEIVVSWAALLFAGYGVLARLNLTAVIAAAIGAFAVGSAMFLILELNQPFTGLFRIPGAGVAEAIQTLNQ